MENRGSSTGWIIGGALALGCLCLLSIACLLGGALLVGIPFIREVDVIPDQMPDQPVITVEVEPDDSSDIKPDGGPTPEFGIATATPSAQTVPDASLALANETLQSLLEETIPVNDPIDLARRLEGKANLPQQIESAPPNLNPGDRKTFWMMNIDQNRPFQVEAVLRYETPHLYFWIEDGVDYRPAELERLAETFENEIYPTNREFFGSEWTPGVDNDPHLYVLYATGAGSSIAGYFSSTDSFLPEVDEYANGHEMFILNADNIDLGDGYTYGTLAHEFQHMILYYQDRNEESWVSEGFSELAQQLNGFEIGGMDYAYVADTDIQLNSWPETEDTLPHYGASFLFMSYFLDRFGEDATKAVTAHPDNGLDAFDAVLQSLAAMDGITGQPVGIDNVFADWAVATFLNDENIADGRYAYKGYRSPAQASETETIFDCSSTPEERAVHQYGVDYIGISCSGSVTLHVEGDAQVGVLPVDANSGQYAFWSNRGDESDMTLTQTFDFTGVSAPISMSYYTWYDLETDYDYAYLVASEDGETWQMIQTPSGTTDDPVGSNYGIAWNGQSAGWVLEEVDLSAYAGKTVSLRFEYVTDAAVNNNGFFVDDIAIPVIGYQTDFEDGDGGWEGEGFVRLHNSLPQTFQISVIQRGRSTTVGTVALAPGQSASVPLALDEIDDAVLVVSGTTRFTTQEASYRFWFTR